MSPRRAILTILILLGLFSSRAFAREEEPVGVLLDAPKTFLAEEPYVRACELGSAVADAVRDLAGADAALVNVGDLRNDLNDGEISRAEVENVFAEDRPLAVAELTPEALRAILEHSVSRVTVDPDTEQFVPEECRFDGFCQISGFRFRYEATALAGERVMDIRMEDGSALGDTVTVCATAYMLDGGYGFEPAENAPLDATLADALEAYVREHTAFPGGGSDRITVVGVREPFLGTGLSRGAVFAGCIVLIGVLAVYGMRQKKYQEEYGQAKRETDGERFVRRLFRSGGGR